MTAALEHLGGIFGLMQRVAARLVRLRCAPDELRRALYEYGCLSAPIALVTAMFSGAIMVIQAGVYIRQYGVYNLVGWFAGFSTLREMAPVLIGFVFAGRVGSHNTSELATMVVGEKLSALELLNIDVVTLWVAPRVVAMTVAMMGLVVLGDAVALIAGALCAQAILGLSLQSFAASLVNYLHPFDFVIGVYKGALFGATVGFVSSHFGLRPGPGASGVGRAVHAQVVASALGLVCVDHLLTLVGR